MKYILSILLITIMYITGCSNTTDIFQERVDIAEKNEGNIVIGVAWDFRNDLFEEGIDLAVEEVNRNGGVLNRTIELVKGDDQGTVRQGLPLAQSFADNKEMVAVIGHRRSAISIPTAAIYDNAGLLMLTPASTSPKLTSLGYEYVFSSIPNDNQIGIQMAEYASENDYRNIALFYKDDAYGRGLANVFEDSADENGIQIIDRLSSYRDLDDLRRIADIWETLDIDAVFLAEDMPAGAEIISDFRKANIKVPIISGNTLDSPDLARLGGNATEGTVVASVFNPNTGTYQTSSFVQAFTEKYQLPPTNYAAQGYDAIYLLVDAIETAESRVPENIANALKEMNSWEGVTGNHTFDDKGNVENKPIVKKVLKNGLFNYLDEDGS